jgi:23S rRNA pseudouridine2605 synthase
MRLNQYLARCGKASRRGAEEMIKDGRVLVNAEIRVDLGCQVDENDQIKLDGRLLTLPTESTVLVLNKPRGVLTTALDPGGRQTVMDFIDLPHKVQPIGRLDKESSGLLMLTDDGHLAHLLMHPDTHLPKEYLITTREELTEQAIQRFQNGIRLDGHKTRPAQIERVGRSVSRPRYRVILTEGRNRQIRRMLATMGIKVQRLARRRYGGIDLGTLEPGEWRFLTQGEIERLRKRAEKSKRREAESPTSSKPRKTRSSRPRSNRSTRNSSETPS